MRIKFGHACAVVHGAVAKQNVFPAAGIDIGSSVTPESAILNLIFRRIKLLKFQRAVVVDKRAVPESEIGAHEVYYSLAVVVFLGIMTEETVLERHVAVHIYIMGMVGCHFVADEFTFGE